MILMLQMGSSNQLMFVLLLGSPSDRSDLCHEKNGIASADFNTYLDKIVALQKGWFWVYLHRN